MNKPILSTKRDTWKKAAQWIQAAEEMAMWPVMVRDQVWCLAAFELQPTADEVSEWIREERINGQS